MPTSRKQKGLLYSALSTTAFMALASATGFSQAACYRHDAVSDRAATLAWERFPTVAQQMPQVLVCSRDSYTPNVAGQHEPGANRITAGDWLSWGRDLDAVLLHELGHAQAWLTGGDAGSDGHGNAWVRAMLSAGLDAEVRRVAGYSGSAAAALSAIAGQGGRSAPPADVGGPPQQWATPRPWTPPPQPLRQVCQVIPQWSYARGPWGTTVHLQWFTVCQWVQ